MAEIEQLPDARQIMQLKVCRARGTVLQLAIETENLIEGYIASKFAESQAKRTELIIKILAQRVGANDKIDVFRLLIQRYDKAFYSKHKSIIGKIKSINQTRNQFAHWPVSLKSEDIEMHSKGKGFRLIRLTVKKELSDKTDIPDEIYSNSRLNDKVKYITGVNILLIKLINS